MLAGALFLQLGTGLFQHGGKAVLRHFGLEDIFGAALFQGRAGVVEVLVAGQDNGIDIRQTAADVFQHLQAVHAGHLNVRQNDVRRFHLGQLDALLGAGSRHTAETGQPRDAVIQPLADGSFVIHSQHFDHGLSSCL